MGFFDRFKQPEKRGLTDGIDTTDILSILGSIGFNDTSSYTNTKALTLSTVYRCVNLISDSIASLPIIPYMYKENWKYIDYDNGLFNLLNVEPNENMSAFTFKKLIIVNMLLKGNVYIYQEKLITGKTISLKLLNSDEIKPVMVDGEIKYANRNNNKVYDRSEIIHIMNYTHDGIIGTSTISHAMNTLGITYDSENHARDFFKGGANLSGILRPIAGVNLSPTKARQAKEDWINSTSTSITTAHSNSIVVLDSGLEYQPISVSPRDSQLLESRQFNVLDVCRFFNVPPALAFSETGKFSTAEMQQIDFLNNTLKPIIEKLENELFRKLYLKSEWDENELRFDVENLFRLDAITKADYYTKLHNIGGYTTNEVRDKLGQPNPVKGGNRAFVQVNLQPIDNLISENQNPPNQIDNKLKNNDNENEGN